MQATLCGMTYDTMPIIEAISLCRPLLELNFDETGFPVGMLDPDLSAYAALDKHTPSFAIVARDGLEPVGLAVVFVLRHPHTSTLFAQNDTLFVRKDRRNVPVGAVLFAKAEREARARGAKAFLWDVPQGSTIDRALARRCEYRDAHTLYFKEL